MYFILKLPLSGINGGTQSNNIVGFIPLVKS